MASETDPTAPDAGQLDVEYQAIVAELAEVQGVINAAEARVVALTARAIEVGVSGGTHLTPQQWVEWQTGCTPGRAADVVKLASRTADLPHTIGALEAGQLSVDQAAAVARHVPSRYDVSAARVASCCTVRQLRKALPWYRDPKPSDEKPEREDRSVSTGVDERGWWIRGRLPEAEGAVVDQALKAMREDLKRRARAEAPEGTEPEPVSSADALVALAETALRAGEAARPGSERYLVHVHLEAGADGVVELMTHLGVPLPDGQRRHLLCDASLRALVHDGTTPLGAGRKTRTTNRRLRRAIEHRDRGCAVPGCGRTHGLEIHHIWHWEDGGPTESWNLVALCSHHHHLHHQGRLGIEGNADLPRHRAPGLVFTDRWGHALDPTGTPIPPAPADTEAEAATRVARLGTSLGVSAAPFAGPTGEPLDRWGFHLNADAIEPVDTGPLDVAADEPPPEVTGYRPRMGVASPSSPAGGHPVDPTRAGPTAA